MLYRLFSELKLAKLNREIAHGLYVSIMTDTNSFRYARTTPDAHKICGEMIGLGVNPEKVYQAIYSSKELSHLQLLGTALQCTQTRVDGKIAWIEMDLATRKRFGATSDDTLSFLNLLLLLRNAEVICLFREEEDGCIRVSIRSKGKITVHRIAESLGGGGHVYASGLAIKKSMREVVQEVIGKIEAALHR
jgi:phosphoesterase RecJ-like protein